MVTFANAKARTVAYTLLNCLSPSYPPRKSAIAQLIMECPIELNIAGKNDTDFAISKELN